MKYPFFFSNFNENVPDGFSKNTQMSSFIRFRPAEAELLRADRRADMTKLTVPFGNYVNMPKAAL